MPTILFVIILIVTGLISAFIMFSIDEYDDFLCVLIPILLVGVILAMNYFFVPSKEKRFVPDTKIVASLDGTDTANLYGLKVGEPFYLQIRIAVASRSATRRIFNDTKIPFSIEISNPEIASFKLAKLDGLVETKPPETSPDKITYYFTCFADRIPQEVLLNLKGTAEESGEQQLKLVFSDKVSGKYSKIETLVFTEEQEEWILNIAE
ncbi:MAG: hypothetical protein Ta2B_06830 [Termitinemataceae bacterium]|nr:MAG: hypothetical protein Ta2B_06830 [Termitinemataceae bacterium]